FMHLLVNVSFFFFSSRRRHTRSKRDWSSDVCSSDLSERVPDGAKRPVLLVLGVMIACVIVDGVGHALVGTLHLALYLDMIGTAEIGRASCRERVEMVGVGGRREKQDRHTRHVMVVNV